MFQTFLEGVSPESELQKIFQNSLLAFFTVLRAIALSLLYSIMLDKTGHLSIHFLALRLLAIASKHSLDHHGLLYLAFVMPFVFPHSSSALVVRDLVKAWFLSSAVSYGASG